MNEALTQVKGYQSENELLNSELQRLKNEYGCCSWLSLGMVQYICCSIIQHIYCSSRGFFISEQLS